MPAATKKELKIARSIAELNTLANDIPKLTDARKFLKTAEQVFKKADELNLQGDEESSYIMYMRYFNIISAIKKSSDYRKNEKFFKEMIGSSKSIRAITEAERLSGSLKNRYEEKEAEQVSEKLEAMHIKREKEKEVEKAKDDKAKHTVKDDKGKKSSEATKDSENDAESAEQNGQPKSKLFMTVHELYGILKQSPGSVLIMDVRSPEQYTASRINHKNIINVPFEIVPPGTTVNYIEKALPEESRGLWMRRTDMEHIVILDWRCGEEALAQVTTLASLKDALWKWDIHTILKSEPVVLMGGYDEWLNYYPTLSTNANVTRPPRNDEPISSFSLDSIQYDFDEGFLTSPEKEEKTPSKLDLLRQELADLKEANAKSADTNANSRPNIPSIDRSLKPSADLNNSIGRLLESGSSTNISTKKPGLEMIKNELKKDLSEDDSYNKNSLRSGDSVQNKNIDLSKAPVPTSSTPTLAPKVNNVPSVNRTLKPKLGSAEGSALASAEHEAAHKARLESQQRYDVYKAETHGLVEDRKAKIAQLMEEEKRVEDLKRKELAETAEVMRIKRRIQKEVDNLKAEQERTEAEGRSRKDELERLLNEEAQKLQLRREAERLRALKKRDNNAGSGQGSREDSPVHQTKDPVASVKDDKETVSNEANEKQEAIDQELERREIERREYERKKEQLVEQERRLAEQEANERQERERLARELKQEQERQAEVKRLERERTDKEWIERENKKAASRDGGTPVSRRDPITGSYTPVNAPNTPSADSRPASASAAPTSRPGTPSARVGTPNMRTPAKGIVPGLGPVTPENRTSYKTRLRDEDDTPRSGGLRRSHSSPNIAQLVQDENIREPLQPHFPNVDRGSKPRSPRPELQMVPAKTEVSAAKVRNLQPTWGNVGRGLTGLRNLGNTCYMNSTIQCLSNTSFLTTYFLTDNHRMDINRENVMGKKGEVAEEFAVLIKALWTGQYRSITPRDFKGVIGKHHSVFAGYDQQDSQEMLLFLMDSLHEDLNKIKKRPKQAQMENDGVPDKIAADRSWISHKRLNDSIIVDLFQGQFMSTVSCLKCDKASVTFDSFMFLTVPIPSNSRCTLRDCLLHFAKEEKMTGDSQWHCPRCKCPRDAKKRIVIYRLPRILLIHLKRFYYQGMWRQKINAHVDFPLDGLDLNHYIEGPEKQNPYHLYAVSNHYGTMEGGHYTAFCKSPSNSRWYKYDDHEVYDMSRSDIKSSAAYILCYSSIQQDLRFAS